MSVVDTLLELAERCEAAEEPDRELDALIWCATAESHFEYHGGECVLAVQGGFSARLDWKDLPHPTASLDAAMTLVPEGWGRIELGRYVIGDGYWCSITLIVESDFPLVEIENATTPALALTAAALRARAYTVRGEQS